jgi:hypothetical protein
MAFNPINNQFSGGTTAVLGSPFMGNTIQPMQTVANPSPVCSRWGGWHDYRCEAVDDKLVVVLTCACGHVIRDFPEGYNAAKT